FRVPAVGGKVIEQVCRLVEGNAHGSGELRQVGDAGIIVNGGAFRAVGQVAAQAHGEPPGGPDSSSAWYTRFLPSSSNSPSPSVPGPFLLPAVSAALPGARRARAGNPTRRAARPPMAASPAAASGRSPAAGSDAPRTEPAPR